MSYFWLQQAAMQAVWFSCVLGSANHTPWLGTVVGLGFVAGHLTLAGAAAAREAGIVLGAGLIGVVSDMLLVGSGAVAYTSGDWLPGFGPHWMIVLWMAFATTLNVAYPWLRGRPVAAAAMGALFGPLSYWAGERLGGVSFPLSAEIGLGALAATWILAFPMMVYLAERLTPDAPRQPQLSPELAEG